MIAHDIDSEDIIFDDIKNYEIPFIAIEAAKYYKFFYFYKDLIDYLIAEEVGFLKLSK